MLLKPSQQEQFNLIGILLVRTAVYMIIQQLRLITDLLIILMVMLYHQAYKIKAVRMFN
jgi:hypothetical protein